MPSVRLVGSRSRRLVLPALVAGPFLALAGGSLSLSGPAAAQPAPAVHVGMKDFAFAPTRVTVKEGTTVTWTYDEVATDPAGCESPALQLPGSPVTCPGHSTTAVDKGANNKPLWDSGVHRASGFPFSFTFTKPGTYHYICVVHGGAAKNNPLTNMEGDVVVEAAAIEPAPVPGTSPTTAKTSKVLGASAIGAQAGGSLSNTGGPVLFGWALLALAAAFALRSSLLPGRR
jgi:plastocyanin